MKQKTGTIQRDPFDRVKREVKSVSSYLRALEKKTLRDDYPTQRYSEYWEKQKQYDLVSTILHGYPIPDIIIAEEINDNDTYWIWLLDGLQRLSTLAMYRNNAFKCGKNTDNPVISYQLIVKDDDGTTHIENKEYDIRGKLFRQLPPELQERFDEFNIGATKYLACTPDDIEYHIRRYNNSRAMTAAQKGITYLGGEYAKVAKKIVQMDFFRDKGNYTLASFKNGAMERVVLESIMTCFFIDDWNKNPNAMCSFLQEHAKVSHFNELQGYIERLDEIVESKEDIPMFNSTETILFMPLFRKFTRLGLDDSCFMDFLKVFDTDLRNKTVNGTTYEELKTQGGTKDKTVIINKIELLTALMTEYLGAEETSSVSTDEEAMTIDNEAIADFIDDFTARDIVISHVDTQAQKNMVAVQSLMAVGVDDIMLPWEVDDATPQSFIDTLQTKDPEIIDSIIENADLYTDCLEDWIKNIDNNSPLLNRENIPALVGLAKYVCDILIDDSLFMDWLENYALGYTHTEPLSVSYLCDRLDTYIAYINSKNSGNVEPSTPMEEGA